jgi:DnaJ-class molecular chaperone
MISSTKLEEIELETVCLCCHGTGGPEYKGDSYRCKNCDGAGYVPTEFGKKVLAVVQHNFKPMLQDATDD